ncbi:Elongator subunit elp2 [Halocaridina rubra]|uniref:Elongator complex protein 2 n=1 Tax=Halocaridina rubra TaxID=373956 RepID=A0AAN9AEM8_HALRR
MKAEVKYISSGVNQTPRCFSWGNEFVAYVADTRVLLYDPKSTSVVGTSPRVHTQKIQCVRWVKSTSTMKKMLITTGFDSKTVVWTISDEKIEGLYTLEPISVLDHEDSVSMADSAVVTSEDSEKILIVTVMMDIVCCWTVCPTSGENNCVCTFTAPGRTFILSLLLFEVEEAKYPLLLCGGHDSRIHIFSCSELGYYTPIAALNGHEDWVTSLDIMLEASGSKDATVRLWRFSTLKTIDESAEKIAEENKILKLRSVEFQIAAATEGEDLTMSVLLDAILAGHEGLVSEVYWARSVVVNDVKQQPYKLLSCSKTQDRSIIMWEPEEGTEMSSGIWLETARLGEVGGNMEGYFACQFNHDSSQVLGCSYQGGLHLWEFEEGMWNPCVVVGGHFKEVADIVWDPLGRYLLSTSKDQTTRLHAAWKMSGDESIWHEVGRPQVHGYDMTCICSLGSFKFASGAEEKVVREFSAPANTIRNFGQICGENIEDDIAKCEVGEGASVPSLGLSNKAVLMSDIEDDKKTGDENKEEVLAYFKPVSLTSPPTEDQLLQNTLWPEAAKLYGHGNDLMALASTSDGAIIASSCKATQEADANIILWEVKTWRQLQDLPKHRLTVTQMEFSPDDKYLLSVSRDRTWTIFKREALENEQGIVYKFSDFSKQKDTAHSRVIWSCAWLADSMHFVTASRDKSVAVWKQNDEKWTRISVLTESDEVTAVATIEVDSNLEQDTSIHLVATGLVNGSINIRRYNTNDAAFSEEVLQVFHKHHSTVKRLRFRPGSPDSKVPPVLAACSEDNGVHLYEILV